MIKRIAAGLAVTAGAVSLAVATTATPAQAAQKTTQGTTGTSLVDWKTGTNEYYQRHDGDDFAFTNNGPATIDMRWVKCSDHTTVGTTQLGITPNETRVLGRGFYAGTCLQTQYRAYTYRDTSSSFSGVMRYNEDFA